MALTNYGAKSLLNMLVARDSTTLTEWSNAEFKLGLFSTDLEAADETPGTGNTEITSDSGTYARITEAEMIAAFGTLATTGTISNDAALDWAALTPAIGVDIKAVALINTTNEKIWMYYNLDPDISTPASGTVVQYAAGALTFTFA